MIKFETHCHTYGTSYCADTPNEEIVNKYLDAGYSQIVCTNHLYQAAYEKFLSGRTHKQKMDSFFNKYSEFSTLCQKNQIATLMGAEIRVMENGEFGQEFCVIGLDEKFFYDYFLFEITQEKLFELCEKCGAFMYQTHPFRDRVLVRDPKFMHGAESFNGHYHHDNHNQLADEFCNANGLVKLSGTDFHHGDQPITAGLMVDHVLSSESEYVQLLRNGSYELIKNERVYLESLNRHKSLK